MHLVQHKRETTRVGGVTGAGFVPGQSGNPGGRPKGLSRRVRELVGDDGHVIAEYMLSVMTDREARTRDRLEAAKWLADRGFGRPVQTMEVDVSAYPFIDVRTLTTEDLEALSAILERYRPDVDELATSGQIRIGPPGVT